MIRDIEKRKKAIELRQAGHSIREITKMLKISSSSASIWCREVKLTKKQKAILASKSQNTELLRYYANKRHLDKLDMEEKVFNQALNKITQLDKTQLFIAGISLYWAEGFKNISEGRIGFCNSDPKMIKFMMHWFKIILKIPNDEFTLRVEFNSAHKDRKEEIEQYWSDITNIPTTQFNNSYLQKTVHLRDYSKKPKYYGVLRIRVRRSSKYLPQIRGWIEGLSRSFT